MSDLDQNNGNHDNGQNYDDQEEVRQSPKFNVKYPARSSKTSLNRLITRKCVLFHNNIPQNAVIYPRKLTFSLAP